MTTEETGSGWRQLLKEYASAVYGLGYARTDKSADSSRLVTAIENLEALIAELQAERAQNAADYINAQRAAEAVHRGEMEQAEQELAAARERIIADLQDEVKAAVLNWQEHSRLREAAEQALKLLHDRMYDDNAAVAMGAYCRWCKDEGYDGDGLKHKDDCPLIMARKVLGIISKDQK